jgi:hypothetical protein
MGLRRKRSRPINDLVETSAAAAWMNPIAPQDGICYLRFHGHRDALIVGLLVGFELKLSNGSRERVAECDYES